MKRAITKVRKVKNSKKKINRHFARNGIERIGHDDSV